MATKTARFDAATERRLRLAVHRSDLALNQLRRSPCGNDGIYLAYGLIAGLLFAALLVWSAA